MVPTIIAMDLEGVLVPEIWIAVSKKTGIEKLKLTTKDIEDYDELMKMRLDILKKNNLKLKDIQDVISTLDPLDGAIEYMNWVRSKTQVVILSDTYYEFAMPLMKKLGYPTLLYHSLVIDSDGFIADYKIRIKDPKRKSVEAFKNLNFRVFAIGDSFNDISMLKEADKGILFKAPDNVKQKYSDFVSFDKFDELRKYLDSILL